MMKQFTGNGRKGKKVSMPNGKYVKRHEFTILKMKAE